MDDILLGLYLWCVVFSIGCWLLSPVTHEMRLENEVANIEEPAYTFDTQSEYVFHEVSDESTADAQSTYKKEDYTLDVNGLSLREARAVIRALNEGLSKNDANRIVQKVKGRDASLPWLKEQIRTRLAAEPGKERAIATALQVA